jgi:peptidoglycan hydrolase-like protein with peptidoglycan-binding domain
VYKRQVVELYGGPFGPFGKGFRKLHPGDSGADVMEVQRNLKMKGYYKGYLSGYYSMDMERALNKFQKDNNLLISNIINVDMYEKLGILLTE